ncbi:MAG TPA: cytochrome c biogenesis heme-transporting ATPase CcmA [Nevskiales bacterium]|nr:cytochrome c biogenesis heme-transporting ATPase CcmA [Nevskiales bacterium]
MNPAPEGLSADSLACRRGGRQLFAGLSFELRVGEVLQVVGANGSGKTTLLRILCGLRAPDAGSVRWQGRPIAEADDAYTESLSYLGFQSGLKLDLSPRENLAFARCLARGQRRSAAQALELLRLDTYADRPCRQLSTGQLRRVALARLLMQDTPLWILDEPLTGLDQAARTDFEQALFAHAGDGGMVVLTTHHPIRDGARLRQLELGR